MTDGTKVYTVSRWSSGQWFYPATLTLLPTGVRYAKRGLIGGTEETIRYEQVASTRLSASLFFASLLIETTGGSDPIVVAGLRKRDAREIRDAIEAAQGK